MYTSLVFLVVLGMWAAYLVQHSMRRREHLLTARSVDAFTEALRVLERRPSTPTTMPRSYAASPLQATAPTGSTATRTTSGDAAPGARPTAPARLRAAGLVGALVLFLAVVVATLAGAASPLLALTALALLAGDVVYLRWSAALARARRPVARPAARRAAEPVASPVAPVEAAPAPAVVTVAPQAPSTQLFDVRVFDEPAAEPVAEEPPAPGTWRPTPVPAPLYTRKPAAPMPSPAPVLEPVVVEEIDELVDMPSPFRRVVNG